MTPMPQSNIVSGEPSPIVAHRVEQLILYDYFTVLDLSKVELRQEDIDAVVAALTQTKTIEAITLDKCKLKDDGLEQICFGLKKGNHLELKKLSLRQNTIGNRGAKALEFLLRASPTLEELDLSENSISSRGAASMTTNAQYCILSICRKMKFGTWTMAAF
jgi:Ran GTPase-activating protein (RanGAP) involved in mRNA processing and transport